MTINKNRVLCKRVMIAGLGVLGVMTLAACDRLVYGGNPTYLTAGGVETYRDQFALEKDTAAINDGDVTQIARDYWSRGESPMQVMVTYDPNSKTNTAMKAARDADHITGMLRQKGVKNIESTIMPVMASGEGSKTLIGYDALNARGPSECGETLSFDFADQTQGQDYRLGCSIHTYHARQIARPKDLLGRDDMDNPNGRMHSNVLEPYMRGERNAELNGETASE